MRLAISDLVSLRRFILLVDLKRNDPLNGSGLCHVQELLFTEEVIEIATDMRFFITLLLTPRFGRLRFHPRTIVLGSVQGL